jgi:hypothetical protein
MSRREPLVEVLDRLANVKRASPTRYRARCPAHQSEKSKNRSLVVFENENRSVGFHCHGGYQRDEILLLIGLQPSDLFPHDEWIDRQRYECMKENKPTHGQLRTLVERARGAATIVEVGARMLSVGEILDQMDLTTLAGVS